MNQPDIDLLVTRLLEGEADERMVAEIRMACGRDPDFRRRFARETTLHRLNGIALERGDDRSRFAAEVVARLQSMAEDRTAPVPFDLERRLRREPRSASLRKILAIAAVLTLAAVLAFYPQSRESVTLARCESVVWKSGVRPLSSGAPLERGGVLDLESGLVELGFSAGVSVLLEGPARLTVTGPKSAFLDHGRLVARVTDVRGKGFVIDGPSGRVVDLGTAFGVSVERSGEMEVHVLEGTVNASSNKENRAVVSLHKDEAMRIGGSSAERMPADEGAFVTDLPPVPGRIPGFIRWSFDETEGEVLVNSGKGLAEDRASSLLKSAVAGGEAAHRVPGKFGGALAFDGVDDFAESGFEGISGQSPRTVSLWARVPADLTTDQSYAMVSWGNVRGQGSAWQISINPQERDGPLGALRAGTGQAAVVGSTDLRDGEWHHLSVVMYGGAVPSTATHVLLYVDGRLESTTRKSVRVINTEASSDPHGIWLGRNLSTRDPVPPDALFFRGALDEVHVFSAALDQTMIRRVMDGSFSQP